MICSTKLKTPGVMEDALERSFIIQETRQEKRPARMVGLTLLDSIFQTSMEAGVGGKVSLQQWRRR